MRRLSVLLVATLAAAALLPGHAVAFSDPGVEFTPIHSYVDPIAMAVRGDGALYFAQQSGTVEKLVGATNTTVLDITSSISCCGEQGLLGLTFSPDGNTMYVNFTNPTGDTVVRGYDFDGGPVDTSTAQRIIKIKQPFANHNGGNIAFGPDGYLYVGMGDGGGADDPGNRAQDRDSLLGKMLRIDPKAGGGYTIPNDNPYVGRKGRDEIWAKGLRNPWRWSFDTSTDDLWIGDVGQGAKEEVDFQPASSTGGENYGWRRMEGTDVHIGTEPANHTPPVFEYGHGGGGCAIIGGFRYRGSDIGGLAGAYVYTDLCTKDVRAFDPADPDGTDLSLGSLSANPHSFGQDGDGELYVMTDDGVVAKLEPSGP